ncbi:hypothetical protein [Actinoplanes sp. NPDC049681]|uniref:hypothetical protein n=1 Tax=Actinoplanes sp. NPDC049681 TaxID=3363905 RepID=UPI0037B3C0EB
MSISVPMRCARSSAGRRTSDSVRVAPRGLDQSIGTRTVPHCAAENSGWAQVVQWMEAVGAATAGDGATAAIGRPEASAAAVSSRRSVV